MWMPFVICDLEHFTKDNYTSKKTGYYDEGGKQKQIKKNGENVRRVTVTFNK